MWLNCGISLSPCDIIVISCRLDTIKQDMLYPSLDRLVQLDQLFLMYKNKAYGTVGSDITM